MEKIIAAIDGLKYSRATTSWATTIARLANSHLVGVFLEDELYTSFTVYELMVKKDVPEKKLHHYMKADRDRRDQAIADFSQACDREKVNYSIHHDHAPARLELLHESVFADLAVIDKHETLTHYKEHHPTRFIRDFLSESQCPVLVVSDEFKPVKKILTLYDGHPSSVHALKMFSYLFACFKNLPVEVIAFKSVIDDLHLPDGKLMREFVKRHFSNVEYRVIRGNAEESIAALFAEQTGDALVVMGAYGRGLVSRWFRASTADILLENYDFPLFISHSG